MNVVTLHRLGEAPLSLDRARDERASKVGAMARVLLDWKCWADADDCRLVLRHAGFSHFEIEVLMPDARQVVVQHAVEMAMGAS
jgi:hypothetical protein